MDTLFFILAKVAGILIRPESWLVLLGAAAFLTSLLRWSRFCRLFSALTLLALVVVALLPLGDLLLRPLEARYPMSPVLERVDGIVVLGGGEDPAASAYWQQPQLGEGADRYTAALALARLHPEAKVLFTGGSGRLRSLTGAEASEAAVAEAFFRQQGLERERLLLEDRSRNTAENARLAFALVEPGAEETWVLVTSAFHMPRAHRSFQDAGWEQLVPWPVDHRSRAFVDGLGWNLAHNLTMLNTAVKEWVGLLAYRLLSGSR